MNKKLYPPSGVESTKKNCAARFGQNLGFKICFGFGCLGFFFSIRYPLYANHYPLFFCLIKGFDGQKPVFCPFDVVWGGYIFCVKVIFIYCMCMF